MLIELAPVCLGFVSLNSLSDRVARRSSSSACGNRMWSARVFLNKSSLKLSPRRCPREGQPSFGANGGPCMGNSLATSLREQCFRASAELARLQKFTGWPQSEGQVFDSSIARQYYCARRADRHTFVAFAFRMPRHCPFSQHAAHGVHSRESQSRESRTTGTIRNTHTALRPTPRHGDARCRCCACTTQQPAGGV